MPLALSTIAVVSDLAQTGTRWEIPVSGAPLGSTVYLFVWAIRYAGGGAPIQPDWAPLGIVDSQGNSYVGAGPVMTVFPPGQLPYYRAAIDVALTGADKIYVEQSIETTNTLGAIAVCVDEAFNDTWLIDTHIAPEMTGGGGPAPNWMPASNPSPNNTLPIPYPPIEVSSQFKTRPRAGRQEVLFDAWFTVCQDSPPIIAYPGTCVDLLANPPTGPTGFSGASVRCTAQTGLTMFHGHLHVFWKANTRRATVVTQAALGVNGAKLYYEHYWQTWQVTPTDLGGDTVDLLQGGAPGLWFRAYRDGTGIYCQRATDEGASWETAIQIANDAPDGVGPTLALAPDESLLLAYHNTALATKIYRSDNLNADLAGWHLQGTHAAKRYPRLAVQFGRLLVALFNGQILELHAADDWGASLTLLTGAGVLPRQLVALRVDGRDWLHLWYTDRDGQVVHRYIPDPADEGTWGAAAFVGLGAYVGAALGVFTGALAFQDYEDLAVSRLAAGYEVVESSRTAPPGTWKESFAPGPVVSGDREWWHLASRNGDDDSLQVRVSSDDAGSLPGSWFTPS